MLQRLSTGIDALVRQLPRQPGQREQRWIHLAGEEGGPAADAEPPAAAGHREGERPRLRAGRGGNRRVGVRPEHGPADPSSRSPSAGSTTERLDRLEAAVGALEGTVNGLARELHALRADLGEE